MTEPIWKRRFRVPRTRYPSWARDDPDRLVYLSNKEGKDEVYAWDRARGTHRRVTDRPEGTGFRVRSRIDPSGRDVWWFADRKGDEFGRWVVTDFERRASRTIDALEPSYSTGLALGHGFAVVGRSTAAEGATAFVLDGQAPARRIYAHREHASVGDLSRDGTLVALSHSEHGDVRNPAVRIVDLAGRAVTEIWDGPDRGLDPMRWSPVADDQRLIVLHEREGVQRPLLLAASGEQRELPIDLPGELAADWYPKGDALLITHDYRGRDELYRYEVARGRLERIDTEPGTIRAARVRPDGSIWYEWESSRAAPITRSVDGPILGDDFRDGAPYAPYDVNGVPAFLAEPRGPRPHPTYVFVHGGPKSQDRDAWSPSVQAWVDHGFAVALVNYRGSDGYGREWRDAIRGKPGLTELEDVATVHDRLIRDGIADPARSFIGGGSWGGYLTLLALGTQPDRWALGLARVPIGDYVAAFEDEMEPLKRYDAALFGGTPAEVPDVYRERNPITYIERVRAPALLLVGDNDPRCPPRGADNYIVRLVELGKPHEIYRYDAGHGSLVVDEQIRQLALQIDFVARYLGTRPVIE